MYQVNFSDQAMRELAKLPTLEQMEVVEAFSSLTPEALLRGSSDLGTVRRDGHVTSSTATPTRTSLSVRTCRSPKMKPASNKKAASGSISTTKNPNRELPPFPAL
jgi:hypothetical protein